MTDQALISVLVPVYRPDPVLFERCLHSVISQTFPSWELCVALDGPQTELVNLALEDLDARIRVVQRDSNGGIAAATNDALALATGTFIALLDQDDVLPSRALGRVAHVLHSDLEIDMLFTDEDKLDLDGNRVDPFLKPAWSPERLRTQMYTGHLGVYRRSTVQDVGGFRPGFDGSQDHDLALRVSEVARRIAHIPDILYHWRQGEGSTALAPESKDWAYESGQRAVQSHLERITFPAQAIRNVKNPGVIDLIPRLPTEPSVSVIIPTGGATKLVRGAHILLVENAVESLVEHTTYGNVEIIVVLDSVSDPQLGDGLKDIDARVRVVKDTRPFNFSGSCNLGAVFATGDVLLFLNDDTEIVQKDWIQRLVMYAQRPDIGPVGAKLLYADGRIQHAGIWSRHGGPGHRYPGFRRDHPGHMGSLFTAQNCMGVTGACLAVERAKFDQVGGFSLAFPLNFNDVDLCLKLVSHGYRAVVDCGTEVIHLESASRNPAVKPGEYELLRERWADYLDRDFWDNPNHTGHGVQEFPATSESLIQSWEAIDRKGVCAARVWDTRTHTASVIGR